MSGEVITLQNAQIIDYILSWNSPVGPMSMGVRKPENDIVIVRNSDKSRGLVISAADLDEIVKSKGL